MANYSKSKKKEVQTTLKRFRETKNVGKIQKFGIKDTTPLRDDKTIIICQ